MRFKTKAALKLAKIAKIDLASESLDDVTIYFLEGDELVEGIEVFSMNDDGEYISFPDGEYAWGEKVVIVENSIVKSINEKSETGETEMKKIEKLETEVVTVDDFNALIEVVNEVIDEVDKLGGDVETVSSEELTTTKEKLSKLEEELKKTQADLKLAKETSNREFEEPEKKGGKQVDKGFDPNAALAEFGL